MRLRPSVVRFSQTENYHAEGQLIPNAAWGSTRGSQPAVFDKTILPRSPKKGVVRGQKWRSKRFFGSVSPARKSKGKAAYATFPFPALIKPWALPIPDLSLTIAPPFRILLRPWVWRIPHFSLCALSSRPPDVLPYGESLEPAQNKIA